MSPKGTNNATCFSLPVMRHAMQSDVGRILRVTLQVSNAHMHIDKDPQTHTHTHTKTHSSSLFFDAKCQLPEPQTQFSMLLWASAVNSAARQGNRQHLSWATRWCNVVHTAVGVTIRSEAVPENQNPFYCKKKKKMLLPPFHIVTLFSMYIPFMASVPE